MTLKGKKTEWTKVELRDELFFRMGFFDDGGEDYSNKEILKDFEELLIRKKIKRGEGK